MFGMLLRAWRYRHFIFSSAKAQQAEQRASHAEARAHESEIRARQAEELAALAETNLQAIFNSHSWRVTEPLRRMGGVARILRGKSKRLLKGLVAPLLLRSMRFAKSRPGIKNVAIRWLGKYPRLASKLRGFAAVRGLIDSPFDETSNSTANAPSETEQQELIELSPRAREIYFELKAAIGRNQESK
jgi:G3E family GTPase